MYPKDLKYTKTHEWIKIEDNIATIGITSYAVDKLKEVIYIEFTVEVGEEVKSGDVLGMVESQKATVDIFSPLNGEVIERNEALLKNPSIINKDPYTKEWLVKIKVSDKPCPNELLDALKYEKFSKTLE